MKLSLVLDKRQTQIIIIIIYQFIEETWRSMTSESQVESHQNHISAHQKEIRTSEAWEFGSAMWRIRFVCDLVKFILNLLTTCIQGYGSTMKINELSSRTIFCINKNIDCTCFGKKILRYRFTNLVGCVRVKMQFKPGQEFKEYVHGNGFGKSLITCEGNRMIHIQRGDYELISTFHLFWFSQIKILLKKEIRSVSEFHEGGLVMTITVDHVTAKRYFNEFWRNNLKWLWNLCVAWIIFFYKTFPLFWYFLS